MAERQKPAALLPRQAGEVPSVSEGEGAHKRRFSPLAAFGEYCSLTQEAPSPSLRSGPPPQAGEEARASAREHASHPPISAHADVCILKVWRPRLHDGHRGAPRRPHGGPCARPPNCATTSP